MAVERERTFSGDRDRWDEDNEGTLRRDDHILFDVQEALHAQPGLDPSHIVVQVRSCEVTLSGTVPEPRQVPLAEECARSVEAVAEVFNYIGVEEPPLVGS